MSTSDIAYLVFAFVAVMVICSLPGLVSLKGAGRRYRAGVRRGLAAGWLIALGVVGWMALGGYFLSEAPAWFHTYARVTWGLMIAGAVVLPFAIRLGNRRLAALQAADARG